MLCPRCVKDRPGRVVERQSSRGAGGVVATHQQAADAAAPQTGTTAGGGEQHKKPSWPATARKWMPMAQALPRGCKPSAKPSVTQDHEASSGSGSGSGSTAMTKTTAWDNTAIRV